MTPSETHEDGIEEAYGECWPRGQEDLQDEEIGTHGALYYLDSKISNPSTKSVEAELPLDLGQRCWENRKYYYQQRCSIFMEQSSRPWLSQLNSRLLYEAVYLSSPRECLISHLTCPKLNSWSLLHPPLCNSSHFSCSDPKLWGHIWLLSLSHTLHTTLCQILLALSLKIHPKSDFLPLPLLSFWSKPPSSFTWVTASSSPFSVYSQTSFQSDHFRVINQIMLFLWSKASSRFNLTQRKWSMRPDRIWAPLYWWSLVLLLILFLEDKKGAMY